MYVLPWKRHDEMLDQQAQRITELETRCKALAENCLEAQRLAAEVASELQRLREMYIPAEARRRQPQPGVRVAKNFTEFRRAAESPNQRSA